MTKKRRKEGVYEGGARYLIWWRMRREGGCSGIWCCCYLERVEMVVGMIVTRRRGLEGMPVEWEEWLTDIPVIVSVGWFEWLLCLCSLECNRPRHQ